MSDGLNGGPRPPDGDWLGTPFLRFEREGAFAVCPLDRPKARNAMTPAMYFGIRYAISRVNADPDLAGLLITGTGDVFAPGGDLGQSAEDNWMDFAATMGMDATPFDVLRQSPKPVVSAVNGLAQGGGLQIAMCSDLAVVSDRATFRVPELFRYPGEAGSSQLGQRDAAPRVEQHDDHLPRPDAALHHEAAPGPRDVDWASPAENQAPTGGLSGT